MKYSIIIDKERDEEVLIYVKERNDTVDRLEALLKGEQSDVLIGHYGNEATVLQIGEIVCFTVSDGVTYALTDNGKYKTKLRLYQAEESYGADFLKINQSCIVNVKAIQQFDVSLGGSLMILLKNGYRDYVSRRQLKAVKERIGFKT